MKAKKSLELNSASVRIKKIKDIRKFGDYYSTLLFNDGRSSCAIPGQYLMVWVIGHDEIPLSISHVAEKEICGVTVKVVGETTRLLCSLKKDDTLGVRGPFGKGYTLRGRKPLLVAGGIGVAGIHLLAQRLIEKEIVPTLIIGSKTSTENIFHDGFVNLCKRGLLDYFPTTDDGSLGEKGTATDLAQKLLEHNKFDQLYGCGPEKMLYSLFKIAVSSRIELQLSLERFMKCAVGICGQCVLDDSGLLVCEDGPVFGKDDLQKSSDFGRFIRTPSGKKVPI